MCKTTNKKNSVLSGSKTSENLKEAELVTSMRRYGCGFNKTTEISSYSDTSVCIILCLTSKQDVKNSDKSPYVQYISVQVKVIDDPLII